MHSEKRKRCAPLLLAYDSHPATLRRGADELLEEAVDHLASYNEWFKRKVRDSQAAVTRGETVPHGGVREWLEAREQR